MSPAGRILDKRMTAAEIVAQLSDGMTIGIGGWGPRRKPMALVREIMRSDLKDLTVVAYGGADVGMLCGAGKVRKLVFAFVSLDAIPLEPWFRKARESGAPASLMGLFADAVKDRPITALAVSAVTGLVAIKNPKIFRELVGDILRGGKD